MKENLRDLMSLNWPLFRSLLELDEMGFQLRNQRSSNRGVGLHTGILEIDQWQRFAFYIILLLSVR